MTMHGVILGTAAYMAPEQAKGRSVDRRADIWSFGCVLYEMLTASRAFDGEDTTEILGAIVKTEPDWSRLPPATPAYIVALLRRCLEKDLRKRLPDIGVARQDLEAPPAVTPAAAPAPRRPWMPIAWVAGGVAIGALTFSLLTREVATAGAAPIASAIEPPDGQRITRGVVAVRGTPGLYVDRVGVPRSAPDALPRRRRALAGLWNRRDEPPLESERPGIIFVGANSLVRVPIRGAGNQPEIGPEPAKLIVNWPQRLRR